MNNSTISHNFTFNFSDLINQLNENAQINESFNSDENSMIKPVKKSFIKELNENRYTITANDQLSCCLCMEGFKEGEQVYKLPCKPCNGNSHYFHINKDTNIHECNGIEEWFLENSTCPICRTEFPYDEIKKEKPPEIIQYPIEDIINHYDNRETNMNIFINNFERNYFQNRTNIENEISPPIALLSNHIVGNIMNQVFEEEEERQIQEAIELSLRD